MKLVIDSSIFVAAFREQEQFSREAFRILENVEKGIITAYVPVSVIIEVVAAIKRRTGSSELAKRVGEKILSFAEIILIDLNTFRMAHCLSLAIESGLAGMDIIVVGAAQEFDTPLLTLDKELAEKAKRFAEVCDLQEVLSLL